MPKPITQLDVLNSTIAQWNDQDEKMPPYFWQGKLTPTYYAGKQVSVYYGRSDAPDLLDRRALDTKVNIIDTSSFATDEFTMLDFSKGKTVTEQIRDDIRSVLNSATTDDNAKTVLGKKLYTDMAQLFKWDYFTKEKLFWEGALTGKLALQGDGLPEKLIDFRRPKEHEVKVATSWGNADSAPIDDLRGAVRKMSNDNNTVISEAIMNPNTAAKLTASGQIRQQLYPGVNTKVNNLLSIDPDTAKQTAASGSGLQTITVYDKADANGYLIPNDVVLLVPEGPLGRLAYSTTPAVYDFAGSADIQVAEANNGVSLYTYMEPNPGVMNGILQSRFLPVIDASQRIMTMHVGDSTDSSRDGNYTFDTYTPSAANDSTAGAAGNSGAAKSSGAAK